MRGRGSPESKTLREELTPVTLGSTGPIRYDPSSRTMRWRTTKNMVLVKPASVTVTSVYSDGKRADEVFYGDSQTKADWAYAAKAMAHPDVTGVQVQPAIYREVDPTVGPAF